LQHVVVASHEQAQAGLRFARDNNAGRLGFVVLDGAPPAATGSPAPGLVPVSQVARVTGTAPDAIRSLLADAWIADSFDAARAAAAVTAGRVATQEGDVFRGTQVVEGGARAEARGILTTKREIKELRERADTERAAVDRLREEIAHLDVVIAGAESAIMSMQAELHRQEKSIVGFELQVSAALETAERLSRKQDQITNERRSLEEERRTQESRQDEARASISRIEGEQRTADEQLNAAQRRLFDAREAMQDQGRRTAEAKAAHAALVERASGLAIDIQRLDEAQRDLEQRLEARRADLQRNDRARRDLVEAVAGSESQLAQDLRTFDALRE